MYYEFFNNNNNPRENLNKQLNINLKHLYNFKSLISFTQIWFSDYFNRKKTPIK
jgi:hypothetical protein